MHKKGIHLNVLLHMQYTVLCTKDKMMDINLENFRILVVI